MKKGLLLALALFLVLGFSSPASSQGEVVTFTADLNNGPGQSWYSYGDVSVGGGILSIDGVNGGFGLNSSEGLNVFEISSEMMLPFGFAHTGDHGLLMTALDRTTQSGDIVQAHINLLNQLNPEWCITVGVHKADSTSGNQYLHNHYPAEFDKYHKCRIAVNGSLITMYVDEVPKESWTWDQSLSSIIKTNAYVAGDKGTGTEIKGKFKNITVKALREKVYKIGSLLLYHLKKEDGSALNQMLFSIQDEVSTPAPCDFASNVELIDPSGRPVHMSHPDCQMYRRGFSRYDAANGQWLYNFSQDGELFQNYGDYRAEVYDSLVVGNYTLNIIGKDGKTYQKIFQFNGQVDLPPMSNNHFKYEASENGGLIWTWDEPFSIKKGLQTSAIAIILVFEGDRRVAQLIATLPSHLGGLFVPPPALEKLVVEGSDYKMLLILRSIDENNRSQSDLKKLELERVHKVHGKGRK